MTKNPFPPSGGSPLSSPGLKPGASRGHLVKKMAKIIIFPGEYQNREMAKLIHVGQRIFRIRERSFLDRLWDHWKKHTPGA